MRAKGVLQTLCRLIVDGEARTVRSEGRSRWLGPHHHHHLGSDYITAPLHHHVDSIYLGIQYQLL